MKKQLLTVIAAGAFGSVFAQGLPVSTVAGNKKALIEEFTGIHCGYCPDGHSVGTGLYNADPANVRLLNIHSGSFANASTGEQDFTTAEGTAIDGMSGMGITGYPAGDVNRTVLVGSVMAAGRGSWSSMVSTIKTQTAYCNVAVSGTLDATTRVLTAKAEAYFTANSPTTNSLTIMLLEDKVPGVQSNYGAPKYNASNYNPDGTYNHNHLLRKALTPTFGVNIPTTSMGTTFSTSVTYTIPATYGAAGKTTECLLGNLELMAFVTDLNGKNINNVATNSTLTIINYPNAIDAAVKKVDTDASTCIGSLTSPLVKLTNYGATTMTAAVIAYSVAGATPLTYTYSGSLKPYTYTFVTLPTYTFTPGASNTLSVALASVNGVADPVTANNSYSVSIPKTTNVSNSTYIQMAFTQDANGAAVEWKCIDEATGAVVGSDGPFTNLGAVGTKLWNKTFDVVANKCYKLTVTDALGDGINAGIGVGGYSLKANGAPLITFNGVFTDKNDQWFMTSATANGLGELSQTISDITVYPNPAKNNSTISIDLVQNETITVEVLSIMGQVVYSQTLNNLAAGNHSIALNTENWANGMYNVKISTATGTVNRKLDIAK